MKMAFQLRVPLNTSIGTNGLCAWQVAPGITWVQTRSPQFARKLTQRSDSRPVAKGVAGGYLRTFEFRHSLAWAQRLIARYTKTETATNASKITSLCPQSQRKSTGGEMASIEH